MRQGLIIDEEGTQSWYNNDLLHREDGPAIIYSNGDKRWFKEGKIHREDGPAVIDEDGYKCWWLNGNVVYGEDDDNTDQYELSDKMKRQIIKYKLERMK